MSGSKLKQEVVSADRDALMRMATTNMTTFDGAAARMIIELTIRLSVVERDLAKLRARLAERDPDTGGA